MPKFKQAMEMFHSDSLPLLPARPTRASRSLKQNQLIKKLEQKEKKLFPYYLITCLQLFFNIMGKEMYVMLFHQGNSVQVWIKVRLYSRTHFWLWIPFFHICKKRPQTCERLSGRLQRDVLINACWVAHELLYIGNLKSYDVSSATL